MPYLAATTLRPLRKLQRNGVLSFGSPTASWNGFLLFREAERERA